jgi:hypothetical protein
MWSSDVANSTWSSDPVRNGRYSPIPWTNSNARSGSPGSGSMPTKRHALVSAYVGSRCVPQPTSSTAPENPQKRANASASGRSVTERLCSGTAVAAARKFACRRSHSGHCSRTASSGGGSGVRSSPAPSP